MKLFKSDVYSTFTLAKKVAEIELMLEAKRAQILESKNDKEKLAWLREMLNTMQYARQDALDELVRRIVKL